MEKPPSPRAHASMIALVFIGCGLGILAGCNGSNRAVSPLESGGGGSWDIDPDQPGWHYEGIIADNHWHKATLTAGQILRNEPLTWPIQGQADHPHWIEVSVEQLHQLEALERVDILSSDTDEHAHWVTFN